ncbi:MAG TPA: hypothetical protein VFO60_06000, partial [Candidatus Dormibacteraeota bacterium]|nr:hypothetical protein [Candidatus Dormibacteraeota bacterium]
RLALVTAKGSPRRVLVAHDDPPMRHLIEAALRLVGHAVEECGSVGDLVDRMRAADAVVVDGRLGGRRPDEVAALCARFAPDVPRVLVCGAREEVLRMHTPPDRHLCVLAAPFRPADIIGAVDGVTTGDAIPA